MRIHVDTAGDPALSSVAIESLRAVVAYYQACDEPVAFGEDFAIRFGETDEAGWIAQEANWGGDITMSADSPWVGDGEPCGPPSEPLAFNLSRVMGHEVGHLLGYVHVSQPEALMYPTIGFCDPLPASCPKDF